MNQARDMNEPNDMNDLKDLSAGAGADAESASKDAFFKQLADIASAMTAAHGKDFSMGALVLAARFIAEGEARQRAAHASANAATATAPPAAAAGASIILS